MSVTLHIIVEGQTEETFVRNILKPHLASYSIDVSARLLTTKELPDHKYGGGLNKYAQAETDINLWLIPGHDKLTRVTTMFDLYELPKDFPGYREATSHNDPFQRVQVLENALAQEIGDNRFIPYIQLHEFEALLLTDPYKFETYFFDYPEGMANLAKMVSQFQSPEHVNNEDPPSKRIKRKLRNYNDFKTTAGPNAAENIGLPKIREKCKHFAEWLSKLETLGEQI